MHSDAMNYEDAKAYCEDNDAQLASILSAQENTFIKRKLQQQKTIQIVLKH